MPQRYVIRTLPVLSTISVDVLLATWKILMALHKLGFIMDQYGWKLRFAQEIVVKAFSIKFQKRVQWFMGYMYRPSAL
jgi:hypothetical protein